jgi:hypothetical protein
MRVLMFRRLWGLFAGLWGLMGTLVTTSFPQQPVNRKSRLYLGARRVTTAPVPIRLSPMSPNPPHPLNATLNDKRLRLRSRSRNPLKHFLEL